MSLRTPLLHIYRLLLERYEPQHWWPGETPFEVIVGAILTQSAAWVNVEKAISNLKAAGALSPAAIRSLPLAELARLVYPSGYFNAKAHKLKAIAQWLGDNLGDNLERMSALKLEELRESLLAVHGIGEETADSIILYAADKPIFVVDAYTRRIIERLGLCPLSPTPTHRQIHSYAAFQSLFMHNLPPDTALFNEYHALFVRHGKDTCRKLPFCIECCLREICPHYTEHDITEVPPKILKR